MCYLKEGVFLEAATKIMPVCVPHFFAVHCDMHAALLLFQLLSVCSSQ